jgi:hypothetical protein
MAELYLDSLFNDANLISYWRFNGDLADSKGSNTLSDSGTSDEAGGKFGHARGFDGSHYAYKAVPIGLPTGNHALTYSVWINITTQPASAAFIVNYGSFALPYLPMLDIAKNGSNYNAHFEFGSNAGGITGSTNLQTGQWYHIVAMYTTTQTKLYVNGVSDATPVDYSSATIDIVNGIVIGKEDDGTSFYFTGKIDDLAIFDRTLTDAEIARLATAAPSGGFFAFL